MTLIDCIDIVKFNCVIQIPVQVYRKKGKPMSNIPKDPMILLSYINTKLRDDYHNLDLLCDDLNINKTELTEKLSSIDYVYDESLNKFV